MKTAQTAILIAIFAVVGVLASALVICWVDASVAISRAENSGVLGGKPTDTPLTVAEHSIVIAEFEHTWNVRRAPCRSLANLAENLTRREIRALSGSSVSGALASMILVGGEDKGTVRWQFQRVFAACQLEQHYSDTQMLKAWLSGAYFGARPVGIEFASHSLFGKNATELDPMESARLAALLRAPRLRDDPKHWDESARLIGERVAASPQIP